MRIRRFFMRGFGVCLAGMLLAGCAQPPTAEKQSAQAAMQTAEKAEAHIYAEEAMAQARQLWDQAEAYMAEKKYQAAQTAYRDARVAFQKSVEAVGNGKAKVTAEAEALKAEVENRWQVLEKVAVSKAKKIESGQKQLWETESAQVKELVANIQNTIISSPAEAKKKLEQVKALVDKWTEAFK